MYLFHDVSGVVKMDMNRPTISPAAQLVAIMHRNDQFDAYKSQSYILRMHVRVGFTSFTRLYHQLINGPQLRIVPRANLVGLDIWHVDGASSLVVRRRERDEQPQCFELCIFDRIEDGDAVGPGFGERTTSETNQAVLTSGKRGGNMS